MRVLGIIIVGVPVFIIVCGYFNRSVVKPWKSRRHIRRVEAENDRLDRLINDARKRQGRA